jgi:transposase-like protein
VKNPTRPIIFKWLQTAPELILCAVRWYLRYLLSFRDVEELLAERGLERITRSRLTDYVGAT